MGLDPFTLIAQIINFLLLVWLLWRFLFLPVTRNLDARADKIAAQFADADAAKQAALAEREEQARLRDELQMRREAELASVRAEADKLRAQLSAEARLQVEAMRRQWVAALNREREAFFSALQDRVLDQLQWAMHRALKDLADAELQARIAAAFIDRLQHLAPADWDAFARPLHDKAAVWDAEREAMEAAGNATSDAVELVETIGPEIVVSSAFDLPAADRETIAALARPHIPTDTAWRFELSERVGAGVEMRGPGQKLAWSLDDYVKSLRAGVQQIFDQTIRNRVTHERSE